MVNRWVIYGGSFNPPTLAHVGVVDSFLRSGIPYSDLIIVPVRDHMYGKTLTPIEDRVEMCNKTFPTQLGSVCVKDFDVVNYTPKGSMYSFCEYILKSADSMGMKDTFELSIIVGQDQAEEIESKWHRGSDLINLVQIYVVPRGLNLNIDQSKCLWTLRHGHKILPPLRTHLETSSTTVRELVKSKMNIDHLVHPEVAKYIKEKGLYL